MGPCGRGTSRDTGTPRTAVVGGPTALLLPPLQAAPTSRDQWELQVGQNKQDELSGQKQHSQVLKVKLPLEPQLIKLGQDQNAKLK